MSVFSTGAPIEILLVEDNPGDVRLTKEIFKDAKINNNINVAKDGEQAIQYLYKEGEFTKASRPDLILLDWNLPKRNGHEVLKVIKGDEKLRLIPVIVLTSSQAEEDIVKAYNTHANCFITKPVDFDQFMEVIKTIESFWFTVVKLPRG